LAEYFAKPLSVGWRKTFLKILLKSASVDRQPSCHDSAFAEAVGIYRSLFLYLLVAKGTQKPLRCISAGCGLLVSKTNDHKGRPHSGVFVSSRPQHPTPSSAYNAVAGIIFNTRE
jgi:hypothetical protein